MAGMSVDMAAERAARDQRADQRAKAERQARLSVGPNDVAEMVALALQERSRLVATHDDGEVYHEGDAVEWPDGDPDPDNFCIQIGHQTFVVYVDEL